MTREIKFRASEIIKKNCMVKVSGCFWCRERRYIFAICVINKCGNEDCYRKYNSFPKKK